MSTTKAEIVTEAFAELALAGHVCDIDTDEQAAALRKLEMMMAAWEGKGIRIGYAFASEMAAVDGAAEAGIPQVAFETVVFNLARRMAGGKGKAMTASQLQIARDGYDTLLRAAAFPLQQQMPSGTLAGAGNRGRVFLDEPTTTPLSQTQGGDLALS